MKYNRRTQSYTFNQLLTWGRSFNFHNIDLLVGHEFYAYKYEFLSAGKTNLVDGILELRPGTNLYNADSYSEDYRVESFFGRFNYNFNENIIFQPLSVRTVLHASKKITVGVLFGLSVPTGEFHKKSLCRI